MRRARRHRGDDHHHDEDFVGDSVVGAAEALPRGAGNTVLYLPDPESRSGWSLHRVEDSVDHDEPRPIGFRRR